MSRSVAATDTWRASRRRISQLPVASFRSDYAGRYVVHLPPGRYQIVPGPQSPLPAPELQALEAVVAPGDTLTSLDLQFASYIR